MNQTSVPQAAPQSVTSRDPEDPGTPVLSDQVLKQAPRLADGGDRSAQ